MGASDSLSPPTSGCATPQTRFSCNFPKLAFHQGFGISVTLPRIVGQQRALELMLVGADVRGEEALRIGLADRIAPLEELRVAAHGFAAEIAANGPLGVQAIRQTLRGDLAALVAEATRHEEEQQTRAPCHRRLRRGCRRHHGTASAELHGALIAVVGSPPGVDLAAFTRWAAAALPDLVPPFAAQTIVGGQSNITVRVDDDNGRAVVVRRPPLHGVLATAHDVGREHRIIAALHDTPVPVPHALAYCADADVLGAPFFVMDHVAGLVFEHRAEVETTLPEARRLDTAQSLVDTLVALHAVDPDGVGLGDLAKRDDLVRRQLRRWYAQFATLGTTVPGIDRVHEVLAVRVPEQRDATIVHGDYRLGNCIVDPAGGRVAAVLDWELCTLGDPLADVGYLLATWTEAGDAVRTQVDNPSTAPGFPTRRELADRYAVGSGRDLDAIGYYVAFSCWRLACILAGVLARLESGARGEADEAAVVEFRGRMDACVALALEYAAAL